MTDFSNSERIAIDITNNKIMYIEIENGMVKQPTGNIEFENLSNDEQIIINTAIGIIKNKKTSE